MANLAFLKHGLAAGALLAALSGAANAQSTLLPELLVISPSPVPIEASKTGSSVTVMSGEEARSKPQHIVDVCGKPGKRRHGCWFSNHSDRSVVNAPLKG